MEGISSTVSDTTKGRKNYTIVGSDGALETYQDLYQPTQQEIEDAETLEKYILEQYQNVETSFLKLGGALIQFEERKLYLAKGMPTFQSWLQSPMFGFTPAHGLRLMRIVRDLLPLLADKETLLPLSTLTAMLPMLNDGSTPEQISEVYDACEGLTVADAKKVISQARGLEDHDPPTVFSATIENKNGFVIVDVTCYTEEGDIYKVTQTPMKIKERDWPRFEQRFGAFLQIKDKYGLS
jgi:hypothetical protein